MWLNEIKSLKVMTNFGTNGKIVVGGSDRLWDKKTLPCEYCFAAVSFTLIRFPVKVTSWTTVQQDKNFAEFL